MKKNIKPILLSFIVTIAAFTMAIYNSSCNLDKCNSVSCANGGVCQHGSCVCPTGFEGIYCETEVRQKFTGNWQVFEKGSHSLAAQYPIHIINGDADQPVTYVRIYNFYNYFFRGPIYGYVQDSTLIIPVQNIQGKIVYGQGTIYSSNTYGQYGGITMRYIVQDTLTHIKDDFGYEATVDFSEPSQWNK